MIKPLRKRHLQIWIILAALLPLVILFAWLVIPNQPVVKLLQPTAVALLPVIEHTKDTQDYTINIRSNKEHTQWQLEWKNKTVLTVPSAVIYLINNNSKAITKNELIGRIEAKGDYVFALKAEGNYNSLQLVLYDFIHDKLIQQIKI